MKRRFQLGILAALVGSFLSPYGRLLAQELSHLSPPGPAPTVVSVSFFLSDINGVVEEDQTFEFEAILTLRWKDERQAFDPIEVGSAEIVYQGPYQFLEMYTAWWPQLTLANESGGVDRQSLLLKIAPDGSMTYIEEINATAVVPMELRRFPFDRQTFEAVFSVLGFSADEVELRPDPGEFRESGVDLPEWRFIDLHIETQPPPSASSSPLGSAFVVGVEMAREPGYMLRIVVAPMVLLVTLTWCVFWMDRSSVGERMDISFVGILTVVAYQVIVSQQVPRIGYFTLMSVFLYTTYLALAASVVLNLVVSKLDHSGRVELGDRVDRRCRWLFPLTLFVLNAGSVILFFLFT